MALVSSRRFHRFLDKLLELSAGGLDADTFIEVIVRSVRMALAEPVVQRLLHDEPEILGKYLTSGSLAGARRADHRADHAGGARRHGRRA